MEGESKEGNSLAADMMEVEQPREDTTGVKQKMECESIEGNSLAADMMEVELNESTKVAQKAHPENKNEEVAKPELESKEKPAWFIDVASLDHSKLEYMPFYDHIYPFAGIDED